jgi:prolyl-tRNA editing enzyme YbaK/EbsC (Cys-tRNA(Pro) deacylase)
VLIEDKLPDGVKRVAALLSEMQHDQPIVMLSESGKSAAQAAASLGCSVAQIAKSIVFRRLADDMAVMVVASGADRVDEDKVAALVGPIGKANARFVKEKIGYAIGGVCPIGHASATLVMIERNLFNFDSVWAAGGHPHAVFKLTPAQLQAMTGAASVDASLAAPNLGSDLSL